MARTIYTDSSLSVEDQIQLLKSRNLTFLNEEKAKHLLQNVSMFRMKGYLYPLQADRVHHIYRNGASFEQAFELYSFDSDLRRLIFKRIEQIEVSVSSETGWDGRKKDEEDENFRLRCWLHAARTVKASRCVPTRQKRYGI